MQLNVRTHYSRSDEFDYITFLERINIDQEKKRDLLSGNGFVVTSHKAIKDDVKNPDGIYSSKYGPTLDDVNAFGNRYRCECGATTQRFYHGLKCPICGKPVEYKDDNFKMFGYICLKDPYHIIHPNLFMVIASLIGEETFINIITPQNKKDEDGNEIPIKRPKDEPYYGLGMLDFYTKFDEIIDYYIQKRSNKRDQYNDIKANRDAVFTQSIPVFTIHLRPYRLDGGTFHFEGTNSIYNIIAQLAHHVNNDSLRMTRKKKPKDQLLFDMQMKYRELYDELTKIISGKKGSVRALFGGRYNFTARSVIGPDPTKRIDEISLSYQCLCGLLQQRIVSILHKSYSMRYNDAYKFITENTARPHDIIVRILDGIIHSTDRGIPVLINRNPTLQLGGILQMYCVGISKGFTMGMPLEVLSGLAADFDGDTLNILLIINKEFERAASYVFNPRNSLYISKNDGMFNNEYNHKRDTIINMNTLVRLSRDRYTLEQMNNIRIAKQLAKEM